MTGAPLPCSLIAKLEQFTRLSSADRDALGAVTARRREVPAREDIAREGEEPGPDRLVLEGWACRYKQLEDGRRQIIAIILPGDLCPADAGVLRRMDHSIGALTAVSLAEIEPDHLAEAGARHARLAEALRWDARVAASIQRAWTVNLGQREASERLGHLICELHARLRGVGLTQDGGFAMPLRQSDLGEAMGLTSVHINRSLQALRARGLIMLKERRLTVLDKDALRRASLFDAGYLHLGRVGAHLDAREGNGAAGAAPRSA